MCCRAMGTTSRDVARRVQAAMQVRIARPTLIACKTTIGYGCAENRRHRRRRTAKPLWRRRDRGASKAAIGWKHGPFEIPDQRPAKRGARSARAMAPVIAPNSGRIASQALRQRARRLRGSDERRQHRCPRLPRSDHARTRKWRREASDGDASVIGPLAIDAMFDRAGARNCSAARPISPAPTTRWRKARRTSRRRDRSWPLCALRHSRARHGRRDERHGAARRRRSVRRHVPQRSLTTRAPPIRLERADGHSRHPRDDARFHWPRRRWPDAPILSNISRRLRAIPNLYVFRPADAVETAECWQAALSTR